MTTSVDADRLAAVLSRTRTLLLDFDGPVCRLFARVHAPVVAEDLRVLVAERLDALPVRMVDAGPVQVLRLSAGLHDPQLARTLADALRDAELTAAASAAPTPGLADAIQALRDTGRRVAIVSNTSAEAVDGYLEQHGLAGVFDGVFARYDGMDPALLKPDGHLVASALAALDAAASSTALLGDSASDIEAGKALGLPTIGYANRPARRQLLAEAGVDAMVATMTDLAEAIRKAGSAL